MISTDAKEASFEPPVGFSPGRFMQLVMGLRDLDCRVRASYGADALELVGGRVRIMQPLPYASRGRVVFRAWGHDAVEALELVGARIAEGVPGDWAPIEEFFDGLKADLDATPEGAAAKADREGERRRLQAYAWSVYIRLNDPPEGGNSRNYHGGFYEGGLSVFEGYREPGGGYVVDPGEKLDLAMQLTDYLRCGTRAYLAAGRRVGTGGAGEPLLTDFRLEPLPPGAVRSLWVLPGRSQERRGW